MERGTVSWWTSANSTPIAVVGRRVKLTLRFCAPEEKRQREINKDKDKDLQWIQSYEHKHVCTIADVEESKACARIIHPRVLSAETLHVIIRPNGFLYGGVFTRQPAPLHHAAVQTGVHLRNEQSHDS